MFRNQYYSYTGICRYIYIYKIKTSKWEASIWDEPYDYPLGEELNKYTIQIFKIVFAQLLVALNSLLNHRLLRCVCVHVLFIFT